MKGLLATTLGGLIIGMDAPAPGSRSSKTILASPESLVDILEEYSRGADSQSPAYKCGPRGPPWAPSFPSCRCLLCIASVRDG